MMKQESVAQRYAKALLELGQAHKLLPKIEDNARAFLNVFEASRDLRISLSHPNIAKATRAKLMQALLLRSGYERIFVNFLRLLVDKNRILLYPQIYEALLGQLDQSQQRVRVEVTTAQALSQSQREALKAKLKAQIAGELILNEKLDPSLIGGLRVVIGDRVFDNSLSRHLERMASAMQEG